MPDCLPRASALIAIASSACRWRAPRPRRPPAAAPSAAPVTGARRPTAARRRGRVRAARRRGATGRARGRACSSRARPPAPPPATRAIRVGRDAALHAERLRARRRVHRQGARRERGDEPGRLRRAVAAAAHRQIEVRRRLRRGPHPLRPAGRRTRARSSTCARPTSTAYLGPVDLRLGQQIIVWGRADALNPTNNLTPVDFRIRSPIEDDIRLGNVGARAFLRLSPVRLEGVWMPVYLPTELPTVGLAARRVVRPRRSSRRPICATGSAPGASTSSWPRSRCPSRTSRLRAAAGPDAGPG